MNHMDEFFSSLVTASSEQSFQIDQGWHGMSYVTEYQYEMYWKHTR